MSINQNNLSKENFFMNLAFLQAKKVLGNTGENPAVGCIIEKNNEFLSSGSTGKLGRPHAEDNAISRTKKNIKKSNLYVTLEPCTHFGKTPPCVNKIIKKKVEKVLFAVKDVDKRTCNKAAKILRKNKIKVKILINNSAIKNFYKSYYLFKKKGLPFVTAKVAISKDFFLNNKKDKWITNKFSRGRVHLMRSSHDCIITSSTTIIDDNPSYTCRIDGLQKTSPTRIILDKSLKTPINSSIIKSARKFKTIIFYNKINKKKISHLKSKNVKLFHIKVSTDDNFDLKNILLKVKKLGYSRVFLESGLILTSKFLKNGLVNVFELFISNKEFKSRGFNSFKNTFKLFLNKKKFKENKINLFGDKFFTYKIK